MVELSPIEPEPASADHSSAGLGRLLVAGLVAITLLGLSATLFRVAFGDELTIAPTPSTTPGADLTDMMFVIRDADGLVQFVDSSQALRPITLDLPVVDLAVAGGQIWALDSAGSVHDIGAERPNLAYNASSPSIPPAVAIGRSADGLLVIDDAGNAVVVSSSGSRRVYNTDNPAFEPAAEVSSTSTGNLIIDSSGRVLTLDSEGLRLRYNSANPALAPAVRTIEYGDGAAVLTRDGNVVAFTGSELTSPYRVTDVWPPAVDIGTVEGDLAIVDAAGKVLLVRSDGSRRVLYTPDESAFLPAVRIVTALNGFGIIDDAGRLLHVADAPVVVHDPSGAAPIVEAVMVGAS